MNFLRHLLRVFLLLLCFDFEVLFKGGETKATKKID